MKDEYALSKSMLITEALQIHTMLKKIKPIFAILLYFKSA